MTTKGRAPVDDAVTFRAGIEPNSRKWLSVDGEAATQIVLQVPASELPNAIRLVTLIGEEIEVTVRRA